MIYEIYKIIFEADTFWGKTFDITLMIFILASLISVLLESVYSLGIKYHIFFKTIEWFFTAIFTVEYILRIIIVKKPLRYVVSFFGIIDLLSILPSYLGLFLFSVPSLLFIRAIRILRLFRILKLAKYVQEGRILVLALKTSMYKIYVFLLFLLTMITVISGIMYFVEGPANGFTSIPKSMYWTIVTLTTVGYGDIAPKTPFGQFLASVVMILGYSIIAIPTGIYTVEINKAVKSVSGIKTCKFCLTEDNKMEAKYCYKCGEKMDEENKINFL
ncbi:MAG TPA: ion transporter [Spirochaetota bacterium]|nr:ion transporter [Spirochaetota bacterium]